MNKQNQNVCIFCLSENENFSKIEHIIPESLGGDEVLPKGLVCDKCNSYFGKEIENPVMTYSPLAFCRTFLCIQNKKGKFSKFNGFEFKMEGSQEFSPKIYLNHEKFERIKNQNEFITIFPEESMGSLVRLILKMGLEFLALSGKRDIYAKRFDYARKSVRIPQKNQKWKMAQTHLNSNEVSEHGVDYKGPYEKRTIYNYDLNGLKKRDLIVFNFQYWIYWFSVPLNEGDFENYIKLINESNPDMRAFEIKEYSLTS